MQSKKNLKILYVSAEVSPFAKTGGLADVAGSLPKALAALGNDARIVMPRYKSIRCAMEYLTDFPVLVGNRKETCIIRETEVKTGENSSDGNIPVYFVDSYHYFDRDGIYCHMDDADRFVFFCKAVLEMLPRINFQPDIIHCNDWHTGPVCMLLKEHYKSDSFYSDIKTVFTIHNLEYQGHFSRETMGLFNMGDSMFTPDKVEFYGMFNFMKAGLVYTDVINTVSETYAAEIQTPQYGERLEGLLQKRKADLFGIVNGISYEEFNPETDKRIVRNYSPAAPEVKKENKYALQKEMGLPVGDMPVIGLVSRLSGQKGLDLVIDRMGEILGQDTQFVLLGDGDEYYKNAFREIKRKYPDRFGMYLGFNAPLAQRIYAGCDMFLMPSRFEPCGLGQIISLRYGTIPIVRATGGLAETVADFDADRENGNGFSFTDFNADSMLDAVKRAVRLYREEPETWSELRIRALGLDFSWNVSARKYMELYEKAVKS